MNAMQKNIQIPLTAKVCLAVIIAFIYLFNTDHVFSQFDGEIEVFDFIYRQDFSEIPADWSLAPEESDAVIVLYSIANETYRWNMDFQESVWVYQISDPGIVLPDDGFLVSVETGFDSECYECASGILFNYQDAANFYYARLEPYGNLNVYARQDEEWILISDTVQSRHFIPSESNRITVVNQGEDFELQINDYPVFSFSDTRFHGGIVGLIAEGSAGIHNTVMFDNLDVMERGNDQAQGWIEETGEETTFEEDSPYRVNKVTAPMDAYYPPGEGFSYMDYTLDLSVPLTFWKEGRGNLFCPKESQEQACVFIVQHFNYWNSPEEIADDIMGKYAEEVDNFEIYHQQSTRTKDGFAAYWVGSYFSIDGTNYEGSHLFVQVQNVVFQIMGYGTTDSIDKYRQELKEIAESFTFEYY